jgi:hypothetical protein
MEVTAWQQRMPAAAQLMQGSMRPRHVLMLLVVMHIAEGGSMDSAQGILQHCAVFQQAAGTKSFAGLLKEIQQALLHYGLVQQDGYADIFLRNSASNCSCVSSSTAAQGLSRLVTGSRQSAAAGGDGAAAAGSSIGALLVWLTRNAATASFLGRVLKVSCREQQLAEEVRLYQQPRADTKKGGPNNQFVGPCAILM